MEQKNRLSYAIAEFAGLASIPRTAVYAAIRDGKLRTFKLGRRRYVSDTAAREFIAKLEQSAA